MEIAYCWHCGTNTACHVEWDGEHVVWRCSVCNAIADEDWIPWGD